MSSKATIEEIALLANVSTATVSRTFSNPEKVCESTRKRVEEICMQYDFSPRLYRKKQQLIDREPLVAIIVADLKNIFFYEIISSIKKVLNEHGINLAIFDSQESAAYELQNLNFLENIQANGIFITPISETSPVNSDILKSFSKKGVPVILVDRDVKGINLDGVFQNNYSGAYESVSKLVENGHQHIATIAGPISSNPGIDRLNGYLDALKDHQLPVRQEYILYGNNMQDSGYQLTRQLLSRYSDVTAIFAANNLMAVGSLRAIREFGMKIPDDIAFISTGALQSFDLYGDVAITELSNQTDAMGEECAKLMIERLSGSRKSRQKIPAKRITFEMTLNSKGSEVYPLNRKITAKADSY